MSARRFERRAALFASLVTLAACGPGGYVDSNGELSSAYLGLARFQNYAGSDAALVFVAYADNIKTYELSPTYERGESMVVVDGRKVSKSPDLSRLSLQPGSHTLELFGRRIIELNPTEGYDPENYPKRFATVVTKLSRGFKPREVWLLVMFWDTGKYGYLLLPLGSIGSINPAPPPGPGKANIGGRTVSNFVLQAIHAHSNAIARSVGGG